MDHCADLVSSVPRCEGDQVGLHILRGARASLEVNAGMASGAKRGVLHCLYWPILFYDAHKLSVGKPPSFRRSTARSGRCRRSDSDKNCRSAFRMRATALFQPKSFAFAPRLSGVPLRTSQRGVGFALIEPVGRRRSMHRAHNQECVP